MRAVRFHGRGGQGAKTASRILGTAAFLEGFVAQDSPIYGAERRGAPVAAFTRIDTGPIKERGVIVHPDLVVIADASLVQDPAARVPDGIDERTAVFVNSPLTAEQFQAQTSLPGRVTTLDLTDIALQQLGKRGAISALLGAVAGRLAGLHRESIRDAIARELADLGLAAPVIEQNQAIALHCYDAVRTVSMERGQPQPMVPSQLRAPIYEPPTRGTARITAGPNSMIRSMAGWRTFRPVLRPDLCNGCWLCFANCPEGAITIKPDGKPAIYYPHCKGCLDCVEVCPTDALTVERETEATRET
ncbi:MAG: 2-ketoisovalerate ferredoxin reductase, fused gamma and delta subunit [Nitrospirota bacterium]|jgi:pyruvate ferredoxin oxidoreductase gamma subunit